jgi:hypothetical protein
MFIEARRCDAIRHRCLRHAQRIGNQIDAALPALRQYGILIRRAMRSCTCGSANTCDSVFTGPQGTPAGSEA